MKFRTNNEEVFQSHGNKCNKCIDEIVTCQKLYFLYCFWIVVSHDLLKCFRSFQTPLNNGLFVESNLPVLPMPIKTRKKLQKYFDLSSSRARFIAIPYR